MNQRRCHYHYSHVIIALRRLSNLRFLDFSNNRSIQIGLQLRIGMQRPLTAGFLALLFCLAPLSGCFGEDNGDSLSSDDVVITPAIFTGGVFQGVTIAADSDMSAFIPYLILNQDSGFVQNSTVVDLKAGESVLLSVLAPPRTDTAVVLIGEYGREDWPIRGLDESWRTWYNRGGQDSNDNQGITRAPGNNSSLDVVLPSSNNGGDVVAVRIPIQRQMAAAYSDADGGRHSTGIVNGRTTYDYLAMLSDESLDATDLADGAL